MPHPNLKLIVDADTYHVLGAIYDTDDKSSITKIDDVVHDSGLSLRRFSDEADWAIDLPKHRKDNTGKKVPCLNLQDNPSPNTGISEDDIFSLQPKHIISNGDLTVPPTGNLVALTEVQERGFTVTLTFPPTISLTEVMTKAYYRKTRDKNNNETGDLETIISEPSKLPINSQKEVFIQASLTGDMKYDVLILLQNFPALIVADKLVPDAPVRR